ncbi:NUDIX hydrolase [Peribacillus muralis]|uniref:NUDIX hydrolase n=1 Tax=Peribacillus muralis TaxID=264697 RepID=UPI000AF474E3|nr:NUDIX domain-containing protein [Peribacillus muralis]
MVRNRGSIILKVKDKVALIRRCREGTAYYVFPGGGIEKAETPEQAAKREAFEELGVKVEVKDCLAIVHFNGIQYFFLGDIIEGVLGTGNGEEYKDSLRGTYQPMKAYVGKNRRPLLVRCSAKRSSRKSAIVV